MLKSASGAAHGVVTPRPLAPRHGTKGDGANVGGGPAAPGRFGVTVPEGLKALVQECWAPDFEARPDFHVVSKVPPSPPFPPPPPLARLPSPPRCPPMRLQVRPWSGASLASAHVAPLQR